MKPWQSAWRHYGMLLVFVALYCAGTLAEARYLNVPWSNIAEVFRYIALSTLMPLCLLVGFYPGALCGFYAMDRKAGWGAAFDKLNASAYLYVTGRKLAYATLGFLAMQCGSFFLIAKSMIAFANPFSAMKWDVAFAALDKALHFGVYPHTFIIPLVNSVHMGAVLDWLYFFWFIVMTAAMGFNLFGDKLMHRRMRFLWGYVLAWTLLGSVLATILSSVGPVFYNDYFPSEDGGPYTLIKSNTAILQVHAPLYSEMARRSLVFWAHTPKMFDPNAISAMPSLHIAIAWLVMLYAREIGRWFFRAALLFALCIYASAIYFGFHYAIDCYVSVACMSVIWWLAGKCLDRRYPRTQRMEDTA